MGSRLEAGRSGEGEDVVVSVLALSASPQKVNHSGATAPKKRLHAVIFPMESEPERAAVLLLRHPALRPYRTASVHVCVQVLILQECVRETGSGWFVCEEMSHFL